jgi:hypothetical protein
VWNKAGQQTEYIQKKSPVVFHTGDLCFQLRQLLSDRNESEAEAHVFVTAIRSIVAAIGRTANSGRGIKAATAMYTIDTLV